VPVEVLFRLVTHNSLGQKVLLGALLVLLGLSTTLLVTPLTAELTLVVERLQKSGKVGAKGAYAQVSYTKPCLLALLLIYSRHMGSSTLPLQLGL
jgi:hypothetical protein